MPGVGKPMSIEDLRPAMVFIDATHPLRDRRIVILKVKVPHYAIWVAAIGPGKPYLMRTVPFYWTPFTPHHKPRRSGYYLDPMILNNVPEDERVQPSFILQGTRTAVSEGCPNCSSTNPRAHQVEHGTCPDGFHEGD